MRVAALSEQKGMKQYLRHLFGAKKTRVIELGGSRFVEIAHNRPTPIFLAEILWLYFIEPLKVDRERQETQLGSILNGFDSAAFQWQQQRREEVLFFDVCLLSPDCSEMSFVPLNAQACELKTGRFAILLTSGGLKENAVKVVNLEV